MWLTTFPRTIGLTLGIVQTNIGLRSRYTPKQPDVSLYRQPAINDEKNTFLFASLNLQNNILLREYIDEILELHVCDKNLRYLKMFTI